VIVIRVDIAPVASDPRPEQPVSVDQADVAEEVGTHFLRLHDPRPGVGAPAGKKRLMLETM